MSIAEPKSPGRLRLTVPLVLLAGAAGSAAFTLMVGRHNPSFILMLLFTGWVLLPFMGLGLADRFSKKWPAPVRTTLHGVMLVLSLGSLAVYGYAALGPSQAKPAFIFLMVPLASWLLGTAVVAVAGFINSRPGGG